MKRLVAMSLAGAVVAIFSGPAGAAPKGEAIDFDAHVPAADSSVLSHDGNPFYLGREIVARVDNYAADDTRDDIFTFAPQGKRGITFQHPNVADGQHIVCGSTGFAKFWNNDSPSTWWEEVAETGSTIGYAGLVCSPSPSHRFVVLFPGYYENEDGECVSFRRTGENTYSISAEPYVPASSGEPNNEEPSGGGSGGTGVGPIDELLFPEEEEPDEDPEPTPASGCPARILEQTWQKGHWDTTKSVANASAPFLIDLTLRP